MAAAWVANMLAMELTVDEQTAEGGGVDSPPEMVCLSEAVVRSRRTLALKQGKARASVATLRMLAGSSDDVDCSDRMCSRETCVIQCKDMYVNEWFRREMTMRSSTLKLLNANDNRSN